MKTSAIEGIVAKCQCRVFGWESIDQDAERSVLARLIEGCNTPSATILCQPSLARKTTRPPDLVLVDAHAGLHVIEVKGVSLDQIEAIEPGGQLRIRYASNVRKRNPIGQVRSAMFDIKDAAVRAYAGDLSMLFKFWVVFPRIQRAEWLAKWGEDGFCPPDFIFADDLEQFPHRLMEAGRQALAACGLGEWPADQLESVSRAFGDSSVLYPVANEREGRVTREGSLGEMFDEAAETYKVLSDEQQLLSAQNWDGGPRLIRGVAGSGKTIVLANNLARRLHRAMEAEEGLFEGAVEKPRILAVCFNRTLVPFLRKKIAIAIGQRTGVSQLPADILHVHAFNGLMWKLGKAGILRYISTATSTEEDRAKHYLSELKEAFERMPDEMRRLQYDAIYVDEGQDFLEDEFRILKMICRTSPGKEPNLFIFYDDAQNLYGRKRPTWLSLGINVRGGRSHVMTTSFRNTRQIIEPAFNVLYGAFANEKTKTPTKEFGDVATLQDSELVKQQDGRWLVRFARRTGDLPQVRFTGSRQAENEMVIERLRYLIEKEEVRPEDVLVLTSSKDRSKEIAAAIAKAAIRPIRSVKVAFDGEHKDKLLTKRNCLTVSTVASSKGYDAYCVLFVSANTLRPDVKGRATFYVGCTRALEQLDVFAHRRSGLALEMERAVQELVSTQLERP